MKDIFGILADLRRPRILIDAGNNGAATYERERDLTRILKTTRLPRSGEAVMRLLDIEDFLNEQRRSGFGEYSVTRHVEVMVALMSEAGLMRSQFSN